MLRWRLLLVRLAVLLCIASALGSGRAEQTSPAPEQTSRTLVVDGLGKGTQSLGGLWQFRLGDDPRYALPLLDDSRWDPILTTSPWGAQGFPSYAGVAWYRRHLEIRPAERAIYQFRILIAEAEDAYEVYWNGRLIGTYGQFPPHASWYYSAAARSFPLPDDAVGVLAIRVWKAPLDIFSVAESGGLLTPPIIGDPDTISLYERDIEATAVRQNLFDYSLLLLRTFLAALCVILWIRNRREELFLWTAVFTFMPVALGILQNLFLIPFSYRWARCINQPLYALSNIALWFLLISLLKLSGNRRLVRWTRILAMATMAAGIADGFLAYFWASATHAMQWADGLLAGFILVAEFFPFALIILGLQRTHDLPRWAVAVAAFVSQFLQTCADASALGRRFTNWSLYENIIDNHQFAIQGTVFGPQKVSSIALFAAIIFAAYRSILEQQARRNVLEQEMQSAQEIQRILIPQTSPMLEGYAITSAYTPALEVGGDFFQVVPLPDGSAIVSFGDVSGKGLKAAMNVSMILGVMRGQAEFTSRPAELLNTLNHCLHGRMHGGFATGIVFRLDPTGIVTFANAGHLPPFLNGQEFVLAPSLPLGIASDGDYNEIEVQMNLGDQISFYTDGLLEARNAGGELYGFDRLHTLFAARPTAQEACEAAIAFGQDDDITVLTITRLGAGQASATTLLVAPSLLAASLEDASARL